MKIHTRCLVENLVVFKSAMSAAMIRFGYDKINWLKLGEVPHHLRARRAINRDWRDKAIASIPGLRAIRLNKGVGRPVRAT